MASARIYPASYWLALLEPPSTSELPQGFQSQAHWITDMKLGALTRRGSERQDDGRQPLHRRPKSLR